VNFQGPSYGLTNFFVKPSTAFDTAWILARTRSFLNPGQAFQLDNYVCHRTDRPTAGGRHSHLDPPLSARSGPEPLGGYCHPSHIGRQTGDNPCGLPFAFPTADRIGPYRLFRRGIAGLDGWRPQRQTRGLELAAELPLSHFVLRQRIIEELTSTIKIIPSHSETSFS